MRAAPAILLTLLASSALAGQQHCARCAVGPVADFTLRDGGGDAVTLSRFTLKTVPAGRGTTATMAGPGVDLGAFLAAPDPDAGDRFGIGAALGLGALSLRGALSLGEEGAGEGAEVGVTWRAAPGLSFGGGVGVVGPGHGEGQADFAAGVSLGLDF